MNQGFACNLFVNNFTLVTHCRDSSVDDEYDEVNKPCRNRKAEALQHSKGISTIMKMKIFIPLLLSLSTSIVASENDEYDCHDIAVGPNDMAWELEKQGELITGIVVCSKDNEEKRSMYKNGLKHGKEYIVRKGRKSANVYSNGTLIESCPRIPVKPTGTGTATMWIFCTNHVTGERFKREY